VGERARLMARGAGAHCRCIRYVCTGIVAALAYIHSMKKVHRYVKSANILLDGEGADRLIAHSVFLPAPSPQRGTMIRMFRLVGGATGAGGDNGTGKIL
jgi:hypothetical protein